MKNKDKLCAAVEALMREKLPDTQVQKLREEGFSLKSPTRAAVLAIALYKKAEKGDLAALKELRAVSGSEKTAENLPAVVIIDDTKENN